MVSTPVVSSAAPNTAFVYPPDLSYLHVPLATFLESNREYQHLVVSAFIFHEQRVLLVQRSATDYLPGYWEIPGGSCDREDRTILHALQREVFEETGLRITGIVNQIGEGIEFVTGSGTSSETWAKLSFVVEVEEANEGTEATQEQEYGGEGARIEGGSDWTIAIKLSPAEHQRYLWVTKQEVRTGGAGSVTLKFISQDQQDLILAAFSSRKL
ncbi:NUDIX hydrolase domain-like protein [Cryomyces antarcticus]